MIFVEIILANHSFLPSFRTCMASSTTQADMLILDFSKPFDKSPHKRLNYKLNWWHTRGYYWVDHRISIFLEVSSGRCSVIPLKVLWYYQGRPKGLSWDPYSFWSIPYIIINDLPDKVVDSRVLLWLYYLPPNDVKKDTELLQSDLNSVGSWEKTWLMQFNADTCFTMRADRSKNKINASYITLSATLNHIFC